MHPKTKAKTKEITKTVLDLATTGLMAYAAFGSPRAIGKYEKILGACNEYAGWRIRRTLKRLKMQDMIQYNEDDLKSPIVLTDRGMMRCARYKLQNFFRKRKKWDYFWRLVFFDVPKNKKYLALPFFPFLYLSTPIVGLTDQTRKSTVLCVHFSSFMLNHSNHKDSPIEQGHYDSK